MPDSFIWLVVYGWRRSRVAWLDLDEATTEYHLWGCQNLGDGVKRRPVYDTKGRRVIAREDFHPGLHHLDVWKDPKVAA